MSILPDLPATCEHGFPVGHNCRYCTFAPREQFAGGTDQNGVPWVPADVPSGWTCPACGHSYAPWVPECHHCPQPPSFIAKG